MKKLLKIIEKKQVISFDIFDTLLVRPYKNPDNLFKFIETELGVIGFYQARLNAESTFYALNGYTKEADINDIYSVLPQYKSIQNTELELEKAGLCVNEEMKAVYDYAVKSGKTVIISSDMYLPYDFITKLLQNNGITGYKKLYLSNHINKRKDRGDMYDYIIKDLNVAANQILHIGDNKVSDYKNSLKHGISSFLYKKVVNQFLERNKQFAYFSTDNTDSLFVSICTSLASQYNNQQNDYWDSFGYYYAGPIVYSYANYIYQTAKEKKLTNILFVARDGYIIQKVFNIINKENIQTHYVYAPRILNYTANLDFDALLPEQPKIVCDYFKKETGELTPHDFFQQNIEEFRKLAKKEKEKAGYAKYINNICGEHVKIGVVDTVSGQLSAQKLIEKESGKKTTGFYIATIAGRNILKQLEHYDFFGDKLKDIFCKDNKPDLIELIFSAPEYPIITMKDGQPVYQSNISKYELKRHEIYCKIEKGVLKFVNDITKRLNGINIQVSENDILSLINAYVEKPAPQDIKAMFEVKKSPFADNSKYVPLFSAPNPFWKVKQNKKLVWLTSSQRIALCLFTPLKIKIKKFESLKLQIFPLIRKKILKIIVFGKFEITIGNPDA